MNRDTMEGKWKQVRGRVQQKWGKLTDDELDQLQGHRDELIGTIQEKYGQSKEDIDRELRKFETLH